MKKVNIYILAILIVCSCSTQDDSISYSNRINSKRLNVKTEDIYQGDTKAHIENLKVIFDNEDKITVFDNNTDPSMYTYSIDSKEFSGTSVSTGSEIEGVFALYPYSDNIICDGAQVQASFPATQKYEENSFSNNSHIMFGVTDNVENGITLKNMCSYIKLQLYGNSEVIVKEIKLSSLADGQFISGDFYISKDDDESEYSLKMYDANNEHTQQSSSVILDCSAEEGGGVTLGSEETPTIFYIAVPAQNYSSGFKITVTDIFGREITKTASTAFELERSHIKPMAKLENDMNAILHIMKDTNGNYYATAESNDGLFPIEKFLKWGYLVNHCNNSLGITLTGNVEMPEYEIKADQENKTYIITDTPITITEGTPSGSNWVPLKGNNSDSYYSNAIINGNNFSIRDLRIYDNNDYVGFVRILKPNAKIINVTFEDAYIYGGGGHTGGAVGYSNDATIVENVHIKSSHIVGISNVGGIVGRNYRRRTSSRNEKLSYIINCSTDENSYIETNGVGQGKYPDTNNVGGICGYNYGAVITNCTNNADIKGPTRVGGIAGCSRCYYGGGVNGYIIASNTTDKATITATDDNGYAGGITGMLFHNTDHTNSQSYIVACYSLSTIEAKNAGSIVGDAYEGHHGSIYSSFADKKELSSIAGYRENQLISNGLNDTDHFASKSEITEDYVNKMNNTIDEYNNTVTDIQNDAVENIKCYYKWQYNAGEWPTLVESTVSSNP